MTRSYSLDLRERVARFVEEGGSPHAAAACFGVSISFAVKLMAVFRATGSLKAKPEGGWRYSKLDPYRDFLLRRVAEQDDITMPELAAEPAGLAASLYLVLQTLATGLFHRWLGDASPSA